MAAAGEAKTMDDKATKNEPMATAKPSTTDELTPPPPTSFLEEGLLMPRRNPRLFYYVLALNLAWAVVVAIPSALVFWRDGTRLVGNTVDYLAQTSSRYYSSNWRAREVQDSACRFLVAIASYFLVNTVFSAAVTVVSAHAAVATSSAGDHERPRGLGSLLASATGNIQGPSATAVLSNALPLLHAAAFPALVLVALMIPLWDGPVALATVFLIPITAVQAFFLLYLCTVLGPMAIIVSVAEPGCHGPGAFRRALKLATSRNRKALQLMAVQCVTVAAIWTGFLGAGSTAYGALVCVVYVLLMGAVQVVSVCAVTALYYECKVQVKQDEASAHIYAKVQTDEAADNV